jgi:TolB-like protein/DNA-binding winged helix-turn-helix (wHTH) protein/lipoprotein NlpI
LTLRGGFTLGHWTIYPLEGRLVTEGQERRVQPKSMDVLLCLAEAGGAVVERESLLRAVWGERAVSDEPLTRCIGELRKAFGDSRTQPQFILTVPKRGYQLLKPAVSFEPAIEETGDTRVPTPTEPLSGKRFNTAKKIALGVALLLVAALVEVIIERAIENTGSDGTDDSFLVPDPTVVADRSIVVLPFVNMSADDEQEYFSDGISEELLNLLARVSDLRVISRSSAFSYKGKNVDIPTIARQLRVTHVLEGSVRMSGDQVRITAQLIDARNDSHLWSETYDRTLDDIFATQDEIAAAIVEQLNIELASDAPSVPVTDPEAYSLLLQANYHGRSITHADLELSNSLYRRALEIDPDYALAWAGLAGNFNNIATNAYMPVDEGFGRAREAANKALAIDPDIAGAHGQLGWISMWHDNDLVAASGHYSAALALDPANLGSIANAAILLKGLGRLNEAIALMEYQVVRDPVNPTGHFNLGLGYLAAGRWEESIASQRTVLQLSPDYVGVHSFIGTALLMLGEPEAALEAMQREPSHPYQLLGLVMAQHALGRSDLSDAALEELIQKYEQGWAYNIAYVLAFRNDSDAAFEWLDKAVAYRDPGLADIVAEILFSSLHLDPRWRAFLERIGKSPEELAAIEFDVAVSE